jgi:hypothetical protein
MMGTCHSGDIIRTTAKLTWNAGADEVQNVYHLKLYLDEDMDDTDVHDAIASHLDDCYDDLEPYIAASVTFSTIQTWNVTQDRPMLEAPWPVQTVGGAGQQLYATQFAPLCLFSTQAPRSQGRKYLPPVTEGDVSLGGVLSANLLLAMADFVLPLITDLVIDLGKTAKYGNWNKSLGRFAPWVSAILQAVGRTQRRRVSGIGS